MRNAGTSNDRQSALVVVDLRLSECAAWTNQHSGDIQLNSSGACIQKQRLEVSVISSGVPQCGKTWYYSFKFAFLPCPQWVAVRTAGGFTSGATARCCRG